MVDERPAPGGRPEHGRVDPLGFDRLPADRDLARETGVVVGLPDTLAGPYPLGQTIASCRRGRLFGASWKTLYHQSMSEAEKPRQTSSEIEVRPVYTEADVAGLDLPPRPGEFP